MKNSNYPIGNRTRDLPTCSAVQVCISIYPNSVLRYRFLIFDTHNPDIIYRLKSKDVRVRGDFGNQKESAGKLS